LALIGCHECDAAIEEPYVPEGGSALCSRCGGTLIRRRDETVQVTLALFVSGAILFVVANANVYPVMEVKVKKKRRKQPPPAHTEPGIT